MSGQGKPVKAPASYPSLQGKLVRASRFTDGTIRTFFAPGQTEYTFETYENPTAWRPKDSLLKMPQVVWLSCHFPYSCFDLSSIELTDYHITERSPLEPDASWVPYYETDPLELNRSDEGLYVIGPGYDGTTGSPLSNPSEYEEFWAAVEYKGFPQANPSTGRVPGGWLDDRVLIDLRSELDAVFQSVKTSIESIRPGRTWVHVNHWWFTLQFPQFDTCLHMFAPPTDTPYVGTDFLHMYFGMVAYQGTHWTTPYDWSVDQYNNVADPMKGCHWRVTPVNYVEPGQGYATGMKGSTYDASIARLQAAQDRFAGFRVMLFGHEATMLTWDLGDSGWVSAPYSDLSNLHTAFLEQQGTDLAAYGYSYEGMGTGISADTLKNKIAAHFGFNPSTGADL